MTAWRTVWHDAFAEGAAGVPRTEPRIEDMVGTAEARRAQVDAAYRRATRDAREAGRPPPQRRSIARRFQRYAAAEGRERRRPRKAELKSMRRVYHAERRKEAKKEAVLAAVQRANARGGAIVITRPYLRVSPKARRGDRRGRPRDQIIAQLRPGDLDDVEAALARGDERGADDALTAAVIADYAGDLEGTDTTITEVAGAMTLHLPGGA